MRGCSPSAHALGGFELGLSPAPEHRRIEAHVRRCPLCAGELRVLREHLNPPHESPTGFGHSTRDSGLP
ncbi:MAG TPA: hypothetical protein VH257_14855 [Chloroflexota bacterium]|nr:hypothetical protein [Chloroflexota bacterium]